MMISRQEEGPEEGPDGPLGGSVGWREQGCGPNDCDNRRKGDELRWIWDLDSGTVGVLHEGDRGDKNPPHAKSFSQTDC